MGTAVKNCFGLVQQNMYPYLCIKGVLQGLTESEREGFRGVTGAKRGCG